MPALQLFMNSAHEFFMSPAHFTETQMATPDEPKGYQCEFKEPVNQLFHCHKCSLVAREITLTACCGESYCSACLAAHPQENGQPCPACGEDSFTTIKPGKYTKQIEDLQVCCSLKGRGCEWTGPLGELDLHLDPDQDHCQYVDTKCPMDYQLAVPRNQVHQHVAAKCPKRDFTCQHCGFKATYEEVTAAHLPECRYVPVQCPNLCGVTGEREHMEDHARTCRLEEVACEFSDLGCADKFTREEKEKHQIENSVSHLSLLALSKSDDKKVIEQNQKKIEELEKKIEDLESSSTLYDHLLERHALLSNEVRHISAKQSKLLQNLERIVNKLSKEDQNPSPYSDLSSMLGYRTITMTNFSREKARDRVCEWRTPVMYTSGTWGYPYSIGIDANGYVDARGKALSVCLWYVNAIDDKKDYVRWPAHIVFTIELVNRRGGKNIVSFKETQKWIRYSSSKIQMQHFRSSSSSSSYGFVNHDKMEDYIKNDSIIIAISDITIL